MSLKKYVGFGGEPVSRFVSHKSRSYSLCSHLNVLTIPSLLIVWMFIIRKVYMRSYFSLKYVSILVFSTVRCALQPYPGIGAVANPARGLLDRKLSKEHDTVTTNTRQRGQKERR